MACVTGFAVMKEIMMSENMLKASLDSLHYSKLGTNSSITLFKLLRSQASGTLILVCWGNVANKTNQKVFCIFKSFFFKNMFVFMIILSSLFNYLYVKQDLVRQRKLY